jgi:hypothetical protein
LVANIVSVVVVDCLEPVDIDQKDAQRKSLAGLSTLPWRAAWK